MNVASTSSYVVSLCDVELGVLIRSASVMSSSCSAGSVCVLGSSGTGDEEEVAVDPSGPGGLYDDEDAEGEGAGPPLTPNLPSLAARRIRGDLSS